MPAVCVAANGDGTPAFLTTGAPLAPPIDAGAYDGPPRACQALPRATARRFEAMGAVGWAAPVRAASSRRGAWTTA